MLCDGCEQVFDDPSRVASAQSDTDPSSLSTSEQLPRRCRQGPGEADLVGCRHRAVAAPPGRGVRRERIRLWGSRVRWHSAPVCVAGGATAPRCICDRDTADVERGRRECHGDRFRMNAVRDHRTLGEAGPTTTRGSGGSSSCFLIYSQFDRVKPCLSSMFSLLRANEPERRPASPKAAVLRPAATRGGCVAQKCSASNRQSNTRRSSSGSTA